MKNIHILPTDKPSRLYSYKSNLFLTTESHLNVPSMEYQNIYITSDEEIKENDWCYNSINNNVYKKEINLLSFAYEYKIILTTDQDLIKFGVQAIDDEFLEWFVKNPSCEKVEVEYGDDGNGYQIIILKKEPKQRLEKYSERFDNDKSPIGNPETWGKRLVDEPNIIDQWLEKNGNPEITKQVDEEAKKLQKQHLIDIMKQDEELGLYEQEILLEEVFNDDKKENIKKFINEINNPSEPNQALKDVAERLKGKELFKESNDRARKTLSEIKSLPKQERSYSEEEVIAFGEFIFKHSLLTHAKGVKSLFEQFKKK